MGNRTAGNGEDVGQGILAEKQWNGSHRLEESFLEFKAEAWGSRV